MGFRLTCLVALATALAVTLLGPAHSASFDCARARTVIERTICSTPELSSLDEQLSTAYRAALAKSSDPEQLKASQRNWLRDARGKCQNSACLTDVYRQRVSALASQSPPAQAQAPAAPPNVAPPKPTPSAPASQVAQNVRPSDAIARCDALAAHPDDPERVMAGVADDKVNAATAIPACEAATKADPTSPRLSFQLARAYLAADRIEDGVEALVSAAQEGHGGALAYLADLHLGGAPGIEADPNLARTLLEKAVASGFEPARKILAEFEEMTEEYARAEEAEKSAATPVAAGPMKPYFMPNIVDNIIARKFGDIESNEAWVKEYLFNIADNIRAICESDFTQREVDHLKMQADADHFNVGQAAGGAALMGGMAQLAEALKNPGAFMRQAAEAERASVDPFEAGMKDTEALFQRHLCKTPGLAKFAKNLKAYVENEEAPLPASGEIMNACRRNPPPSKYNASDFCLCFAGGLSNARVSQANRRELTKNFSETAARIMNIDVNRGQFRACRSGF